MIPATTLPSGANVIRDQVTLSDATHEPPVVPTSPIRKPKKPESDENQRLTTLQVLLNHHASYHIEYEKIYKSSHYSMGLISLHALGGTDSHLTRYASQYETRLTKLSELRRHLDQEYLSFKITHENWKQHIGLKMYYEAFCDFFNDQLEMYEVSGRSYGDLINDYVPHLLPAIWVQALHPIIHLGWGLAAPNPQTVARRTIVEGLAYLCHSYKSCDHTTSGYTSLEGSRQNSMSPLQVLHECVQRWSGNEYEVKVKQAAEEGVYAKMQLSDFQKKMDLLMTHYQSELHSLDTLLYINPNNLHDHIRELTELSYFLETCSKNNFFILHAITGLYALRHIVTYIKDVDNKVKAIRYAFKTILAVYIAEGLFGHSVLKKAIEYDSIHPFIDILVSHYPPLPTWDAMIAKTLDTNDHASADTHTIKLVNVAWRDMQQSQYSDEVKRLMHVCVAKRMRRTEKWEWEKEGVETISPVNGVWNKEKDEEKEWVKEKPEEKEPESTECHDEKHKLEHSLKKMNVQPPIIGALHETMPSPSVDTLTPPEQNDLGLATKNAVASSNIPRSMSLNVAMPTPTQVEQFHGIETDEYHAAHTGSYHPHLDSERLSKHHTAEYLPPAEYAEVNPPPISSTVLNPQDLIPQDESNLAHQGSSHPHLQHINNQHLTR